MKDNVYASFFFFQAEDGIRDLVRSRGLGDVYKRQGKEGLIEILPAAAVDKDQHRVLVAARRRVNIQARGHGGVGNLSLLNISQPPKPY